MCSQKDTQHDTNDNDDTSSNDPPLVLLAFLHGAVIVTVIGPSGLVRRVEQVELRLIQLVLPTAFVSLRQYILFVLLFEHNL